MEEGLNQTSEKYLQFYTAIFKQHLANAEKYVQMEEERKFTLFFLSPAANITAYVVFGCKIHLKEGQYNWRHDSILKTLADFITSVNKQMEIYVDLDLPGYRSPSIVTGESERPDIVITLKDKIYIIELTVGFETRIKDNAHWKKEIYLNLC